MNNKQDSNNKPSINQVPVIRQKQEKLDELGRKREQLQYELEQAKQLRGWMQSLHPRKVKQVMRTTAAYLLGRRNPKQLYSRTYKQKQASNDLIPYVRHLYTKGFSKKALADLRTMYEETTNPYLKEAIAWELALWHARFTKEFHAERAIYYLESINVERLKIEDRRKHSIMAAEAYLSLGELTKAAQLIHRQLETDQHPDLYLALANCQEKKEDRLQLMNRVFQHYGLAPLDEGAPINVYDDLKMQTPEEIEDGPKISVILPAYNTAEGIQIAIESILNQTWKNLELLIIDDCSTDDTWQVIKSYAEKDQRIRTFQTEKNSGPYVARNIGLEAARGEFVTVNDADDWSHAEKLAIQAKHLLDHEEILANTSEQARLLEDLTFYRRGIPGMFIFSNMSSLMFRREAVMEKLGYWDEVRFAADGEFKRRLIQAFGQERIVDLPTGPLSYTRQSQASLTASSAFGYDGFFMGARREYVASFTHHHQRAEDLYYPKGTKKRPFPVPAPMLPDRPRGHRQFDIALAADFHHLKKETADRILKIIQINREKNLRTALIQMDQYRLERHEGDFHPAIRDLIDGQTVQSLVYGEVLDCKLLLISSPLILQEEQTYLPKINTLGALVMIDELPDMEYNGKKIMNYKVRQCLQYLMIYTNKRGRWYPVNEKLRQSIESSYAHDFRFIKQSPDNWPERREDYLREIEPWLIDEL